MIKFDLIVFLISLFFSETFGFVFEVKQVTGDACDGLGKSILQGRRTETFSMKQKLEPACLKGPCVTLTVSSKGFRLMATRGGMFMVFREGIAIHGTHRNRFSKSKPSSEFSSPSRSPRNITPTRSGSCTPPVFLSKDGSVVEKRQPKIPPKGQIIMNICLDGSHSNTLKTRITRAPTDLSPQSSSEISSSSKNVRQISPQSSFEISASLINTRQISPRPSLEIKQYPPIHAEATTLGQSSSDSSSAPRFLKTSESKGTLELLVDHYASIPKADRIAAAKEPSKLRTRSQSQSQSHSMEKPGRTQSCKLPPREELISASEIIMKKSVSSPLSVSETRRRKSKAKAPELELTRSCKTDKRTSSTKSHSSSSTKKSSPHTDSESNTSPRSLGESPRANFLDPIFPAESSPRSIYSANSSGSNSRQTSPRSMVSTNFSKNVDTNVQLDLGDLILVVIPNQDADASVALDMYSSASDKLDEIDLTKMLSIGQVALLKVTEPVEPKRIGGLVKRRSKSFSSPISCHFEPDIIKIDKEPNSNRK